MSTTTDVLSLFKYDPVADADSTFNITQGLNNNWDKIDTAILLAIAAAGAYNPEESYAVGDYCTYKGKLRKCSTAIPTGETWTETHWTTTTVAAELAELSSQLSNLDGEKYTRMVATPPQSWAEVWALTPHVVYSWVQQTPLAWQPEDTPSGALRVELTIHNVADNVVSGSKSATLAYIDGEATLIRYVGEEMYTDASNGRWAKLATATPPEEYSLPLAEGVSGLAKYSKDQFGRVQLRGCVTGATANSVVATLPSGFRPASGAHFIQAISSSAQNGIARVVVRTDGTVYVELPQNGTLASGLSLQLSFAAAS